MLLCGLKFHIIDILQLLDISQNSKLEIFLQLQLRLKVLNLFSLDLYLYHVVLRVWLKMKVFESFLDLIDFIWTIDGLKKFAFSLRAAFIKLVWLLKLIFLEFSLSPLFL